MSLSDYLIYPQLLPSFLTRNQTNFFDYMLIIEVLITSQSKIGTHYH